VGGREILETYSNSASKNTPETDIFPHGPKSLFTSVTFNPSAWGHLNPSSYCDVGRLFLRGI